PGHDIVGAAGQKRVDDGDRVRGKRLLRECRCGRERARGGGDEETTAVHALPFRNGPPTILVRVFAHRDCPARRGRPRFRGKLTQVIESPSFVQGRYDEERVKTTRRLLAWIRRYRVRSWKVVGLRQASCSEPTCGQNAARFRSPAASTSRCSR